MKKTIPLLPCPFCGGEAHKRSQPGSFEAYKLYEIACYGCSARAATEEHWNRRNGILWSATQPGDRR